MTLPLTSDLLLVSPFSEAAYGDSFTVRLEDATAQIALIHVQGAGALDALAVLGDAPRRPGGVLRIEAGLIAALRPDMGEALVAPERASQIAAQLEGERVTVLDMSHGRALMTLSGPHAAGVLIKLCGLDFDERAFPDLHAAQTSVAKVRSLIVRADEGGSPRYILAVDRSHGAYMWGAITDAMQEFLK